MRIGTNVVRWRSSVASSVSRASSAAWHTRRRQLLSGTQRRDPVPKHNVAAQPVNQAVSSRGFYHSAGVQNDAAQQGESTKLTPLSSAAVQLILIRQLIISLQHTNSKLEKEEILRHYDSLKDLLFFLFDPQVRMHIRPHRLKKYLSNVYLGDPDDATSHEELAYDVDIDLLDAFQVVSSRTRTGNDALHFLASFLDFNGIMPNKESESGETGGMTLLDVFYRCLDRNFKAGVNEIIVRTAFSRHAETLATPQTDDGQPSDLLSASPQTSFAVALGKSIEEDELDELFADETEQGHDEEQAWFVSRKLDGVRCIIQVDFQRASAPDDRWRIVDISTFSRSGRPFRTLQRLTDAIHEHAASLTIFESMLQRAIETGQQLYPTASTNELSEKARIYLDGEVCMLVPESVKAEDSDGKESMPFVEDFQAIVGPIRRKDFTIDRPAYFPFDVLTFSEFHRWRTDGEKHEPFFVRRQRVQDFVAQCSGQKAIDGANSNDLTVIRHLGQHRVQSVDEVKQWMLRAAQYGWEGLILRQGGAYEGKRTSMIRKLKQFQEDEYTVLDVEVAEMRLPVGQKYAQRQALASAIVAHKGTNVHIGSGFTAEQRLRFAQRPQDLIGKQITVAYFGESRSATRTGQDEVSLRFPRIKAIWEDGERDV